MKKLFPITVSVKTRKNYIWADSQEDAREKFRSMVPSEIKDIIMRSDMFSASSRIDNEVEDIDSVDDSLILNPEDKPSRTLEGSEAEVQVQWQPSEE